MTADEAYKVRIESVFEGPMDLLVHLIKKHQVDIYDIPIAMITDQYLAYLQWMKDMNIDLAGDFMLMASTLMQIKSKMLLPSYSSDDDDSDDPRLEITRSLHEYMRMKSVAETLAERNILGEKTFLRSTEEDWSAHEDEPEMIQVGLFDLIDAFRRILENIPKNHVVDLSDSRISIKDRISELIDVLEEKGSVTFDELFPSDKGKSMIVITFLSLLEMVKLCLITITQHAQSGVIRVFYV